MAMEIIGTLVAGVQGLQIVSQSVLQVADAKREIQVHINRLEPASKLVSRVREALKNSNASLDEKGKIWIENSILLTEGSIADLGKIARRCRGTGIFRRIAWVVRNKSAAVIQGQILSDYLDNLRQIQSDLDKRQSDLNFRQIQSELAVLKRVSPPGRDVVTELKEKRRKMLHRQFNA